MNMIKRRSLFSLGGLCLSLFVSTALATLTTGQLATLKAAIIADSTLNAIPNTADGNFAIAAAFNLPASPAFIVWKSNVSILATGAAFNGTDWAGMTSANHTRLQTVAQYLSAGYNAASADIRAMFNDIWSGAGGTTTRANLLALWKRSATRAEKLFAMGTGSDASPAALTFEGNILPQDVTDARNS